MATIKKVGYVVLGVRDQQRSFAFYAEPSTWSWLELVNDGNRLEIFSQEMTPADGKQFPCDARQVADALSPPDLETATR